VQWITRVFTMPSHIPLPEHKKSYSLIHVGFKTTRQIGWYIRTIRKIVVSFPTFCLPCHVMRLHTHTVASQSCSFSQKPHL